MCPSVDNSIYEHTYLVYLACRDSISPRNGKCVLSITCKQI